MKLVERHVISKSHYLWSEIDHKAFLSKNLFNLANYYYRQYFFCDQKKLNFNELYHKVSKTDDYQALPTKVSKQIIKRLDKSWKSYFSALREWKKQSNKFLGKPKIPKYKHKSKGRNILPYPDESIYKKALKKGICHLSMSEIKIPTSQTEIIEARIIPKSSCYLIEIVYEKQEEITNNQQIAGVDLGVNNLIAVTTNQTGISPLLIKGRPLKAINTFYNKQRSCLQSQLKNNHNKSNSHRLKKLTHKRNCRVENYLHTASKRVIDWCINNEIGTLIIGQNQTWKQEIKLGKKNNQQFVNIPHYRLIEMLRYKAQLRGIKVIITEESYTSQSSCLDGDDLPKDGEQKPEFSGKRVTRGLYKTRENKLLNADVNGSFNIIKKVIPDVFDQGIKGLPFNPVVVDPLRMTNISGFLIQFE
ncbi:MAG: IS200/IS605 family element transposase accessory protein TnpB [Okeania sp. SIO2G4]|uniref:RNA-guided endonuclease InsQ/TnpB family protein n=1 Tax=unclassified Okeania TaxID=2634635 RepID=UPI0013BDC20C|nr:MULTISPECIES: transposase [unclassified Okeania]NEP73349.1 IS200/IS605 family element transposase accessory protein TnpB [Okeania sp. SIO2G5]NEP94178.1 IS200/IS605 family element transposase accessory protein TnpB [Okeania sp. SIO2F5]NEQ92028.1 IS200/IS605 family element transposase accessory protein TnpB [Okeania sp. SIO2G4]